MAEKIKKEDIINKRMADKATKVDTRRDLSVEGLNDLSKLSTNKRNIVLAEARKHTNEDIPTVDRNKVHSKDFLDREKEEIADNKAPSEESGSTGMIIGALAGFAPALVSALFGDAETTAAALEGSLTGAERGLKLGSAIDEATQPEQDKLDLTFQPGIVHKTTGEPILKGNDGRFYKRDSEGRLQQVPFSEIKTLRAEDIEHRDKTLRQRKIEEQRRKITAEHRIRMDERGMTTEAIKSFNADKVVDNQNKMIEEGIRVHALIDSDNPLADNALPTFLARASGEVGALSDTDRAPFEAAGMGDLLDRLRARGTKFITGRISPRQRKFIKMLADTMIVTAKRTLNRRADHFADQFGFGKVKRPEVRERILKSGSPTQKKTPKINTKSKANRKRYNDVQAELKRRGLK